MGFANQQYRPAQFDGLPAELVSRIFERSVSGRPEGTGLGLALVQKIIVFHNGRVVAGASPLGGASLQITLPVASDARS